MTETTLDNSVEDVSLAGTETPATTQEVTTEKSFLDIIPEAYRDNPSIKNFKSIEDFTKSFVEKDKLIGKKVSEMSPEEIRSYNTKLGVPDSSDKYEIAAEEGVDDPETVSWFKEAALKAGLTKEAAKILFEGHRELGAKKNAETLAQLELLKKTEEGELKKAWGREYDARNQLANEAIDKLGVPDLRETLEKTNMIHSSSIRKALAEVGKILSEDNISNVKASFRGAMTPEEARAEMNRITTEEGGSLINYSHPKHNQNKQRYAELQKIAYSSAG